MTAVEQAQAYKDKIDAGTLQQQTSASAGITDFLLLIVALKAADLS